MVNLYNAATGALITHASSFPVVPMDAANVTSNPTGNIEAETVQAAIEELETEKAVSDHTHSEITGYLRYADFLSVSIDGSSNNVDVTTIQYDPAAQANWEYVTVTGKADNQDVEIVGRILVLPGQNSFHSSNAAVLTYKCSDGTGNNGVQLRVRGTDGTTVYTSSKGTATSKTQLTVAAASLTNPTITEGEFIRVSAVVTVDNNDTVQVGLFGAWLE